MWSARPKSLTSFFTNPFSIGLDNALITVRKTSQPTSKALEQCLKSRNKESINRRGEEKLMRITAARIVSLIGFVLIVVLCVVIYLHESELYSTTGPPNRAKSYG